MTNIFAEPFTLAPLAPASLAPSAAAASASAGPGLGARISNDWSAVRRAGEAKVRQERRSAVERARHSVEAGWSRPGQLTKQERLAAAASKGTRDTGSPKERNAVKSAVQRAMEKVSGIPSDAEISESDARAVREVLRQRYPGRKLSAMIATAEETEKSFLDDPVAARSAIMASYLKMPFENLPTFKAPKYADGSRGSIQRAQQDQADAEDLAAASAKYGAGLNQILKQIEAFDRGMITDAAHTSARLSAAYGAPSVEAEIAPYQQAQAQKQAAKAHQQAFHNRCKGIQMAIQHGLIPGDEETLHEIAEVLLNPQFQRHPTDVLDSLRRAAAIATHPGHVWTTGKKSRRANSDAGSKSISGAPSGGMRESAPSATRPRPRTAVGAAVSRAMGA
ncbi:hypothetical protein SAMN05443247_07621 [Bradyrhizobium erythrophlei]|nr:hypothetical protein SAMN05443247_07621 [Bradyrhizobium erythrophlei]